MLQAILHGKLSRAQENMEDLLTSMVFGLLGYLPPAEGLLPFLQHATTLDGYFPLKDLPGETEVPTDKWCFWPWLHEEGVVKGCEPDVLLRVERPSGDSFLVLVEAKYLSGKSSTDEDDQLAREWHNLVRKAEQENANPVLIYLTADVGPPRAEIEESIRVAIDKRFEKNPLICWLSWRHITRLTPKAGDDIPQDCKHLILQDLNDLMDRLGLYFFRGFESLKDDHILTSNHWSFQPRFAWGTQCSPLTIDWRFSP